MQLSVELTLYPFAEDFTPPIRATIERLRSYAEVQVTTYPTCSVLIGDYDRVFEVLNDLMAWSYRTQGRCVFVAKFIPDYVAD